MNQNNYAEMWENENAPKVNYCWECNIKGNKVVATHEYNGDDGSVDLCSKHARGEYFGAREIVDERMCIIELDAYADCYQDYAL